MIVIYDMKNQTTTSDSKNDDDSLLLRSDGVLSFEPCTYAPKPNFLVYLARDYNGLRRESRPSHVSPYIYIYIVPYTSAACMHKTSVIGSSYRAGWQTAPGSRDIVFRANEKTTTLPGSRVRPRIVRVVFKIKRRNGPLSYHLWPTPPMPPPLPPRPWHDRECQVAGSTETVTVQFRSRRIDTN